MSMQDTADMLRKSTKLSQLSKCTTGVAVFVPHVFLVETFEAYHFTILGDKFGDKLLWELLAQHFVTC